MCPLEHFTRVLGPVWTARELANESFGQVVIYERVLVCDFVKQLCNVQKGSL